MQDEERRNFLRLSGAVLAAGIVGPSLGTAYAEESKMHMEHGGHMKGAEAFTVQASAQQVCATCRYWGGIRKISEDRKTVNCESLGWCNNPKSGNYHTKTTPINSPMYTWEKWEAL